MEEAGDRAILGGNTSFLALANQKRTAGIAPTTLDHLDADTWEALQVIPGPRHKRNDAMQRYVRYVEWALQFEKDFRECRTLFQWLASKRHTCLTSTLRTYRSQIATIMFGFGHITQVQCDLLKLVPVEGRYRDPAEAVVAREDAAFNDTELAAPYALGCLPHRHGCSRCFGRCVGL